MAGPTGARARFGGAALRGGLTALLLALPALILSEQSGPSREVGWLLPAAGGLFVTVEYAVRTPALVDFRHAPPLNRLRFAVAAAALGASIAGAAGPWTEAGARLGQAFVPGVVLAAEALDRPAAVAPDAGLVAALSLAALAVMVVAPAAAAWIVFGGWPGPADRFDRWTNLPTMNPADGPDSGARLRRHGRLVLLGAAALPVLLLALGAAAARVFDPDLFASPLPQLWFAAIWAGLPAVTALRGIALLRLGRLIDRRGAG